MIDLVSVGMMFLGTPYVWGGNDISTGVDCSGYVCELSRSVGLLDSRDLTSQGLHDEMLPRAYGSGIQRNSYLFFGKSKREISHVAVAIDNKYMIEAGGEGRIQTNRGYVRVRPIQSRKDLVAALKVMKI